MAASPTVPGQTGATSEPTLRPWLAMWSAIALDVVVRGIGIGVRVEEEEIHAVELAAVHLGGGGEFEHVFERDRRMVGAGFLADETGPHGVVKFHGRG